MDYDIFDEIESGFGGALTQEDVQFSEGSHTGVGILQKTLHGGDEVRFGGVLTEKLGELVDGTGKCALYFRIIKLGQLNEQLPQARRPLLISPPLPPQGIYECWEVERRVVAHVLVARGLSCRDIEINNPLIYHLLSISQSSNERSNILKGSASHYFGGGVFQELVVNSRQFIAFLLQRANISNLGNNLGTSLSHLLIPIRSQAFIQWEYLSSEVLQGYYL